MARRRILVLAVVVAAVAVASAFWALRDSSDDARPVPVGAPQEETADGDRLAAGAQRSDGSLVLVDEVELGRAGYVVVYEDGGGAPGRVLGASEELPAGAHRQLVVELDEGATPPAVVWVMVHRESGSDAGFSGIASDRPVEGDEGVLLVRVQIASA